MVCRVFTRSAYGRSIALFAVFVITACGTLEERRGAPAPRVRGPIPTRILQPAALVFPGPRPRRAVLHRKGEGSATIAAQYASIFEQNVTIEEAASFDGEIAHVSGILRYAPTDELEIQIEPTLLFASSGFLDRIVDEFHSVTGFAGGGRGTVARDQYSMVLRSGGDVAYQLEEDRVLFGDLPITWIARVRDETEDGPAVAARFTVELPTGDEARGGGSGGFDVAAGVLLERSMGRWTFFGGLDGVHVDQPGSFQRAGIGVRSLLFVNGGLEYRATDSVSLLAQAVLQTPLTRDLTVEEIDREILDLGFGLAVDLTRGATMIATFHEDAVAASGPDLTGMVGLNWRF